MADDFEYWKKLALKMAEGARAGVAEERKQLELARKLAQAKPQPSPSRSR